LAVAVSVVTVVALGVSIRLKGKGTSDGRIAFSLAALSLLLVPAITTGVVVSDGLGSFSTPYQSPAATLGTTTDPERFQAQAAMFSRYYDRAYPGNTIVYAVDTSALAAPSIMVTGREFLPIGGFSGNNPSPTLAQLRRLITSGRVHTFLIPVEPAGNDPRLSWISAHCSPGDTGPYGPGVELRYYHCYRRGAVRTPVVVPSG
jgi:hypothetical protein